MENRYLAWNTVSSLVFQVVAILSGFILPRLILQSFGTEVNGLVNSIMQFLQFVVFLEMGIGAVIQSELYKPLTDGNTKKISEIITSADKFFKNLGRVTIVYIIILMFLYPVLIDEQFNFIYIATLILAMSINTVSQYFFGIVNSILITSDQRGYIQYNLQTGTMILNTIAVILLIYFGASIHFVKFTTSFIYLLRPLLLSLYVNRNYDLNRHAKYEKEPISQNGTELHSILLGLFWKVRIL